MLYEAARYGILPELIRLLMGVQDLLTIAPNLLGELKKDTTTEVRLLLAEATVAFIRYLCIPFVS